MSRFLLIILATFCVAVSAVQVSAVTHPAAESITSDSSFVHIPAASFPIEGGLPLFVDEIPVGRVSPDGYSVEIRYPEFKNLSSSELQDILELQKDGVIPANEIIEKEGIILNPSPSLCSGLGLKQDLALSRKEGFLRVSFCPVVRHEGRWKRILSCQIRVSVASFAPAHRAARALESARWTDNSVLASGQWAKIRVKNEGIYQLTASDIQKMGFSSLANVKVYGYGGRMQEERFVFTDPAESSANTQTPDDLVEVPTLLTEDGRLLFWAEGTLRLNWQSNSSSYTHTTNTYSSHSYYFVTESEAPRTAIDTRSFTKTATQITSVPYATVLECDEVGWYNGGRRLFDGHNFLDGNVKTYRLATPDCVQGDEQQASVDVSFSAADPVNTTNVNLTLNDKTIGNFVISKLESESTAMLKTSTFPLSQGLSATEGNSFQFTVTRDRKARLDYLRVNYMRQLRVGDKPYSFSPETQSGVLVFADGTPTSHVWMLGQKGSPAVEVAATLTENGTLEAPIGFASRRYVCFDAALAYSAPEYVGKVENQNLHAHAGVDYVIIVPASGKLTEQAERLGGLHAEAEGMTYSVVRADQLYNEFSSGTPDANAYRRYLKMLYDKAGYNPSKMPKYCLLMGKSPWDNRFVTSSWAGKNTDDYLLAYEADSSEGSIGSVSSFVTDDFFGLLDDGEGSNLVAEKLDVALGRMVCVTEEEARLLVDKVEHYMKRIDVGSWKNTAVVIGDSGDANKHMTDAENVAERLTAALPSINIQKVYQDRYKWTSNSTGYTFPQATARIKELMKEGALIFNYSGHGSPGMISHFKIMQTPDFRNFPSPHMTLWVLASCEIYPFDSEENNLAETSLYVPDGGSIAFICATRSVYASYNNRLNCSYCDNVMQRDADGRLVHTIGEALRRTKVGLLDSKLDQTVNKLKFVCFGDPALTLAAPTGRLVVDSINGKAVTASQDLQSLPAGSIASISGHVCLGSGDQMDENFEGTVSVTVFDRKETITCKDNEKTTDGKPMVYEDRSKVIYRGSTDAEGGRFRLLVPIPRDISYSEDAARISLYAINREKTSEYSGMFEGICLNGTAPMATPDTIPPTVIAYINSIDNPDYTVTDENPILIADISDDYGINNAGISLGHNIELVLDGKESSPINLNSYFNYDNGSYQKGQLLYEMNGLERGTHTAHLKVWDVNNNVTQTDVHFIVRSEIARGGKNGYITSTRNPATTDTHFILYYPEDTEVTGDITYEVFDSRGVCVFRQSVPAGNDRRSATFPWRLNRNESQPLPGGIYLFRALMETAKGTVATDAEKLIIIR